MTSWDVKVGRWWTRRAAWQQFLIGAAVLVIVWVQSQVAAYLGWI